MQPPAADKDMHSAENSTESRVDPELPQLGEEAADGVCLTAKSATNHQTCEAGRPGACQAGEACMQPLLARTEHLFKVGPHSPCARAPLACLCLD
jgi:hypothetical protein